MLTQNYLEIGCEDKYYFIHESQSILWYSMRCMLPASTIFSCLWDLKLLVK